MSRNANKLLYKVTGFVLCITISFTLFELESFTNLYRPVFSGLVILDRRDIENVAKLPLSLIISKNLSFKSSSALLFLIEVSVLVFVKFREVFLSVSITDPITIFMFS